MSEDDGSNGADIYLHVIRVPPQLLLLRQQQNQLAWVTKWVGGEYKTPMRGVLLSTGGGRIMINITRSLEVLGSIAAVTMTITAVTPLSKVTER